MPGVTLPAHALAADPATPPRVLAGLARTGATTGPYLPLLLSAHPGTPTDLVPQHLTRPSAEGVDDLDRHLTALHVTLALPHLTDATRARVLAATTTAALLAYVAHVEPVPAYVLLELATRTGTTPELTAWLDTVLALHPATPAHRRVAAIAGAVGVTHAQARYVHRALTVNADDLLLVAALAHPDHLRDFAGAAARAARPPALVLPGQDGPASLAQQLTRYADAHDAGHDVLAEHLAAVTAPAVDAAPSARPRAWERAVRSTAHPDVASAALEAVAGLGEPDSLGDVATAIVEQLPLQDTPVWHRARAAATLLTLPPADQVSTDAQVATYVVTHHPEAWMAHHHAVDISPHDPASAHVVAAGWARVDRDRDAVAPPRRAQVASLPVEVVLAYALHPALPEPDRAAAAAALRDAFAAADQTRFSDTEVAALKALTAAPGTGLLEELVDVPLPVLRAMSGFFGVLEPLLQHHLALALRPYHDTLAADGAHLVAVLGPVFEGTTRDLLAAAAAVTA